MYKFNNGYGAIICDWCRVIIAEGKNCDPLINKPSYCSGSCEKHASGKKNVPVKGKRQYIADNSPKVIVTGKGLPLCYHCRLRPSTPPLKTCQFCRNAQQKCMAVIRNDRKHLCLSCLKRKPESGYVVCRRCLNRSRKRYVNKKKVNGICYTCGRKVDDYSALLNKKECLYCREKSGIRMRRKYHVSKISKAQVQG